MGAVRKSIPANSTVAVEFSETGPVETAGIAARNDEIMKRYGMVLGLRPEKAEEYKKLHAAVWPDVLKMIRQCHIRNYSIYLRTLDDGQPYLFSYFEYAGDDFAADMAKMAADPTTQRWWSFCEPCQKPLRAHAPGEWWSNMQEVFHVD